MSGNFFLARSFPILALPSQIAVGIAMAEALERGRLWLPRAYAVACLTVMAMGVLFQSGPITIAFPGSYPAAMDRQFGWPRPLGSYRWISKHVDRSESVMTLNRDALLMAPAYGVFTVMPAWPDPFLGEKEIKRRDHSLEFFAAETTSNRRGQIMRAYDARGVLVGSKHAETVAGDDRFAWVANRPETPGKAMSEGTQELFKYVGEK